MDDLESKVAFLSEPGAYGPEAQAVQVRETRTSWVFLTEDHVFKLKKPIQNRQFDFTALSARARNATDEVRLNRRLAADVYLGVVALVRRPDGGLRIGGEGLPVDWLVWMRRLPEHGFLDRALERRTASVDEIVGLAGALAEFYRTAEPVCVPPRRYVADLRRQILAARDILLHPKFKLSRSRVLRVTGTLLKWARTGGAVARRAAGGHLVEGHGDLRPEHVWLGSAPVVIDCLEFNRDLRVVDPFDELAFLGLECERLGAPWIGPILRQAAISALRQRPTGELEAFYGGFRSVLRASFALRHYLEPPRRKPGAWRRQARDYLALADRRTSSGREC